MINEELRNRKKSIDSSKFRAGLFTRELQKVDDTHRTIFHYYCNCGNNTDEANVVGRYVNHNSHTCSECGNQYFTNVSGKETNIRMGAFYIKNIRTSYINASRINFSAKINREGNFVVNRINMIRDIEVDFLESKLIVHKNNELEYSKTERQERFSYLHNSEELKRINTFFKQDMPTDRLFILDILNRASNVNDFKYEEIEKSKKFYKALSDLPRLRSYGQWYKEPKYSPIYNLINSMNCQQEPFIFLEKVINAEINIKDSSSIISRKYVNNSYQYAITDRYATIDIEKKKLHQQLSCPKGFLKMIRENDIDLNGQLLSGMDTMFCYGNAKKDKSMEFLKVAIENNVLMEVLKNIDGIMNLVQSYNYDHKTLIDYLFVTVPMYQGITSTNEIINLLSDYLDMSVKMGFRFDKYPDSLKRAHDVKMINYKVFRGEKEGEEFENAVRQYSDMIYTNGEYQIVTPRDAKDLVREGSLLHHCIASYKDRVIKGNSMILFMRNCEDVKEPLVSIELNKHYNIVQSRGAYNRALYKKETEFLNEYKGFITETLDNRRFIDKKSKIESFQ